MWLPQMIKQWICRVLINDNDAAIPTSDAILSEFVISYDKDHPKMNLGTIYPSMTEFRIVVQQFAINEEFDLGT